MSHLPLLMLFSRPRGHTLAYTRHAMAGAVLYSFLSTSPIPSRHCACGMCGHASQYADRFFLSLHYLRNSQVFSRVVQRSPLLDLDAGGQCSSDIVPFRRCNNIRITLISTLSISNFGRWAKVGHSGNGMRTAERAVTSTLKLSQSACHAHVAAMRATISLYATRVTSRVFAAARSTSVCTLPNCQFSDLK